MKIVSPYRDYYDACQAFRKSCETVFERTPSSVSLEADDVPPGAHEIFELLPAAMSAGTGGCWLGVNSHHRAGAVSFLLALVGGMAYPAARIETAARSRSHAGRPIVCFTDAELWQEAARHAPGLVAAHAALPERIRDERERQVARFLGLRGSERFHQVCVDNGWPIVMFSNGPEAKITVNARLSDIGFERMMDPWPAFDAISRLVRAHAGRRAEPGGHPAPLAGASQPSARLR